MTAPDPRLGEIEGRHAESVRLLVAPAEGASSASVYEEADGLETVCVVPGYYSEAAQNVLAESVAQMWQDRDYLLAELRARDDALFDARATNERLNRRAQLAESALNAVTSDGRAGPREQRLLREYWQRAEDAKAALAKVEGIGRAWTGVADADLIDALRAAVAAATGGGEL